MSEGSAWRRADGANHTPGREEVEMNQPLPDAAAVPVANDSTLGSDATPTDAYALPAMLRKLLWSSRLNVLLACVPIAIICGLADAGPAALFVFSFLGLIPLAALLGDLTEDLALRTNDAIGALINVTFGNATEIIISIAALRAGEYNLIKQSLAGSVLGNMLLVLGSSLLLGGMRNPTVTFNSAAATTYTASLLLASIAFLVPSAFTTISDDAAYNALNSTVTEERIRAVMASPTAALRVSQQMSVLMVAIYGLYIFFQLKTHRHLFEGPEEGAKAPAETIVRVTDEGRDPPEASPEAGGGSPPVDVAHPVLDRLDLGGQDSDYSDDDETPSFTLGFGTAAVAVDALLISILSEYLVESVSGAAVVLRISRHFIGLVLVPIVGNVAEHASAVVMAAKGKLDISLGIALGSSIQIAMFAMPVIVLVSWFAGMDLDMRMTPFLCASLAFSIVLTYAVLSNGNATWLSGSKLLTAYLFLCVAFLNAPDALVEA